ncbi:hypothetical protein [Brevibacterium sp. K72]|uniref:hypothetical protein n=1 Tax=Brevibacterium sp. K72 TaxID=3390729 RepID=UPI003D2FA16A
MTSERVPTPASIRRQDTINDAITAADRTLSVLRGYRAARRDGFPLSHLARIEAVLERTRTQVEKMIAEEKGTLSLIGYDADEAALLTKFAGSPPPTKLTPVPDVVADPDDVLDIPKHTAGDCD